MYDLQELMKNLPPMLAGDALMNAMIILPKYNEEIRQASDAVRLIALSDIYQVLLKMYNKEINANDIIISPKVGDDLSQIDECFQKE